MTWTKCSDAMPPSGVAVLAFVERAHGGRWTRRVRAAYYGERMLETECGGDADTHDCAGDTDRDECWATPGWYEEIEFGELPLPPVDGEVTHWMPLPEPPVTP